MKLFLILLLISANVFAGTISHKASTVRIGTGVNEDIYIYANNGSANLPYMFFDFAAGTWKQSNDGLTSEVIGGASVITTEGDLILGNVTGDESRLAVGGIGTVLAVNAGGVPAWMTPVESGNTLSIKGQLQGFSTSLAEVGPCADDQILLYDTLEATGWKCTALPSTTPTTTLGDMTLRGAAEDERIAIGGVDQVLTSNGTTASWKDVPGVNYIGNNNLETNDDGYNLYKDVAGVIPVDGTSGTALYTTCDRNATTPIEGLGDLKISKNGNNAQGEGCSYDFTLPSVIVKKYMISIDVDMSAANYADNDMGIFAYDKTTGVIVRFAGEEIAGGKYTYRAVVQSVADIGSYRLIAHIISTNATAYDVYLDNFQIAPQVITHGVASFYEEIDVTQGTSDFTAGIAKIARVGNIVTISGTDIWTHASLSTASSDTGILPSWAIPEGGTTFNAYNETTTYRYRVFVRTDGSIATSYFNNGADTAVALLGTGTIFTLSYVGKGDYSTGKMSSDFSGRDIIGNFNISTAQTISTVSETIVQIDETVDDTIAAFDSANYKYIIKESDFYDVDANLVLSAANAEKYTIRVVKNGTTDILIQKSNLASSSHLGISGKVRLLKDDELTVTIESTADASYNIVDTYSPILSLSRISSPQTMLENELVAARYTSNAAQSIANATVETLIYEDIDYDTHGAYNTTTGEYTIQTTGIHNTICRATPTAANMAAGELLVIYIYINGSEITRSYKEFSATNTVEYTAQASDNLSLSRGDVVTCRLYQSSGASVNLVGSPGRVNFSIVRMK